MARCFLCEPPADVDDETLVAHLKVEHDFDMDEHAEKWPDGEWVIHDTTLNPEDFDARA